MCGYARDEAVGQNPRLTQGERTDAKCITALGAAVREGRACKVQLLNYRCVRPARRQPHVAAYVGAPAAPHLATPSRSPAQLAPHAGTVRPLLPSSAAIPPATAARAHAVRSRRKGGDLFWNVLQVSPIEYAGRTILFKGILKVRAPPRLAGLPLLRARPLAPSRSSRLVVRICCHARCRACAPRATRAERPPVRWHWLTGSPSPPLSPCAATTRSAAPPPPPQDYSSMMAPMVRMRPSQFFKMAQGYEARRPLLPSLPSQPVRIVVEDNADGSVGLPLVGGGGQAVADPSWRSVGLYVKRLGWEASRRDPEYLALWVQVSAAPRGTGCSVAGAHALHSALACCRFLEPRALPCPAAGCMLVSQLTSSLSFSSSPPDPQDAFAAVGMEHALSVHDSSQGEVMCVTVKGGEKRRLRPPAAARSSSLRMHSHLPCVPWYAPPRCAAPPACLRLRLRSGQGLQCRALVLPASTPGCFRISFERLHGPHAAFHDLYRGLRAHLKDA